MANSTDPFGKSVFGGQTSIPGGTSAATGSAAPAKAAPYKYTGQGWNDPLAQEVYQKYAFGGSLSPEFVQKSAADSNAYIGHAGGYHSPMDPKEWGGSQRGDQVNKMINEYRTRGGQGLYDQQAATNPGAVGWPTDVSGNPLPKYSSDMTKVLQPNAATGQWAPGTGGSGSTNTLSPDVLKKMWR
jgi:hypothetical protein